MLARTFSYSLLSLSLALATGCGDDGGPPVEVDAPPVEVDAPPVVQLDCATYCDTVAANCDVDNNQYGPDLCQTVCATWNVGTEADTEGNTLGCHLYHATAAADDPGLHCPHAGPTGGGACGVSACDNFCELALTTCVDVNEQYPDMATCMAECQGFDATQPYNADQTAGNTLACRFYHLTAATNDPATHCAHIVEASAVCQ